MSVLLAHVHFERLSAFEWALTAAAGLAAAWTIWLAVRYTLTPGESEPDHIKRMILDDPPARGAARTPTPTRVPPPAPPAKP